MSGMIQPEKVQIETQRLILRKINVSEAEAVYRKWAENPAVLCFLPPYYNEDTDTVNNWINESSQSFREAAPDSYELFVMELKIGGDIIGIIELTEIDHETRSAETGYHLCKKWWGNGYAAEALRELFRYSLEIKCLNRVWAVYDPRNPNSGKVMQKAGMLYEGTLRQCKIRNGVLVDRIYYSMLKDDWETEKEISYYNALPCVFKDFIDVPELSDGVIHLVCTSKTPGNDERKWVPAYRFAICKGSEKIGEIDLRIGYTDGLYYGGQIGYGIDEKHRGNGYAGRACQLLKPVADAHGMMKLLITTNHTNSASMRVCEKLSCRLVRTARLPEWHDLYKEGRRFSNIYEWSL